MDRLFATWNRKARTYRTTWLVFVILKIYFFVNEFRKLLDFRHFAENASHLVVSSDCNLFMGWEKLVLLSWCDYMVAALETIFCIQLSSENSCFITIFIFKFKNCRSNFSVYCIRISYVLNSHRTKSLHKWKKQFKLLYCFFLPFLLLFACFCGKRFDNY